MSKQVEILLTEPCPKCGNAEGIQIFGLNGWDWWMKCPKCKYRSAGGKTLEAACEDWNRGNKDGV